MSGGYVEERDGGYYVSGSRVSLASIVYQFKEGASPESIRQDFPTLSLEQIYGAIAFFLGNEPRVDAYLRELDQKWVELERDAKPANSSVQSRLEEARRRLLAGQA